MVCRLEKTGFYFIFRPNIFEMLIEGFWYGMSAGITVVILLLIYFINKIDWKIKVEMVKYVFLQLTTFFKAFNCFVYFCKALSLANVTRDESGTSIFHTPTNNMPSIMMKRTLTFICVFIFMLLGFAFRQFFTVP
jgi:hypothetical protein